jgi:hypothetical protein
MSDIDRFKMPPRQTEKEYVNKKQDKTNRSLVDLVEMPPRSGGPAIVRHNSGIKYAQNGSGKQFSQNPNAAMDIRNLPHMPPVLPQSYGSYNNSYPRHTGGPIRHERPQLVNRGTPYNVPPPSQFPIHPHSSSNYLPRPDVTINTNRNVGRSNNTPSGRNVQTNSVEGPLKISFSNDAHNSEISSEIQGRLDSLERTQKLLLKELEANKKGLKSKDAEIESLTNTIEDQKLKLNKREQPNRSNNSLEEDNYRITSNNNRNGYDDDDMFDTTPTTGSINSMFAKARSASNKSV